MKKRVNISHGNLDDGKKKMMNAEVINDHMEMENLAYENESFLKDHDDNDLNTSKTSDLDVKIVQKTSQNQSIKKDLHNIFLLLFLYFLQGVPLGLTGSLPYILSSRKASYADQGTFSFAFWPFSLKLLWAPIVDSIYFKKIGRRKSWLVPIQYLIGIFMLTSSHYVYTLVESNQTSTSDSKSGIYMNLKY